MAKKPMETVEAYLIRKHEELKLLNGCLRRPSSLACPRSVADVIQRKFQLTAALKAEHALQDWATTETAWAHPARRESGPFRFSYDYQRADLDVEGPSFYELGDDTTSETIYTASGMAAISAVLLASAQVIDKSDILVLPGSYGETQELIEGYARHLRLVRLSREAKKVSSLELSVRVLLLDSAAPAVEFEAALGTDSPGFDLLIFDTTCFSAGSIRIRRVINWARRHGLPVVMVRSHTKLDSLGAEYGRLGSVTFVGREKTGGWGGQSRLAKLPGEVRNAIRLLGGAALPAHFPPYIGSRAYRELTSKRLAAILRNSGRSRRYFRAAVPDATEEVRFAHGLYLTLKGSSQFDEATAQRVAAELSEDLGRSGFPIRHAGSFGFDFAATEWFHNPATGRYSVRVAVPDLPSALWDDLVASIARWWSIHQGCGVAT
jgi:hypothetical protein